MRWKTVRRGRQRQCPCGWLRLAAHPTAVAAAFRQLVLHSTPPHAWTRRREIERLDAEFHYRRGVCRLCPLPHRLCAGGPRQIGGKKLPVAAGPLRQQQRLHGPGRLTCKGRVGCCDAHGCGRSSRRRPCRTMRAVPRWRPGAARRRCWASRLLPPGSAGAWQNTRGCGAYFCGSLYPDAAGAGLCGWHCSARLPGPDVTLTMAGGGWERFAAGGAQLAQGVLGARFVRPGMLLAGRGRQHWKAGRTFW